MMSADMRVRRDPRLRIDADPEDVERGLVTLVELLRQLMERQALRRVDQGTLSDEMIDEVGRTLMALDQRMTELVDHFGLTRGDLNIDLGPLGQLLPTNSSVCLPIGWLAGSEGSDSAVAQKPGSAVTNCFTV